MTKIAPKFSIKLLLAIVIISALLLISILQSMRAHRYETKLEKFAANSYFVIASPKLDDHLWHRIPSFSVAGEFRTMRDIDETSIYVAIVDFDNNEIQRVSCNLIDSEIGVRFVGQFSLPNGLIPGDTC